MNSNMNELNLNEMEQVNGGSVIAIVGLVSACIGLGVSVTKFGMKIYKDITSEN